MNAKPKHTPGPWIVENQNGHLWVKQPGLTGFSISLIGHEGVEANARLIAAAPMMLDLLIEIEKGMSTLGAAKLAKKVIEKATGGET